MNALIAKEVSNYNNLKYVMISSRHVYGYNNLEINVSEDHELNIKNNALYGVTICVRIL